MYLDPYSHLKKAESSRAASIHFIFIFYSFILFIRPSQAHPEGSICRALLPPHKFPFPEWCFAPLVPR
jgi:hypothetical protein